MKKKSTLQQKHSDRTFSPLLSILSVTLKDTSFPSGLGSMLLEAYVSEPYKFPT